MFHAAVFVMMSRRLSDQSKLTIRKGRPSCRQRARSAVRTAQRWTMSLSGKPAKPVPTLARETLSLDGKSTVGAGDSTPTGV